MLKELKIAIDQKKNQAALFLAPTNAAVDALEKNGISAFTVSYFLLTCHEHRDIKNLTIVVDEAGLLSSKQGAQLLYIAEKYNWRIIFSGDTRQHSSVEAGDFVRGLEEYSKILTLSLSTINRQQTKYYKEIVELLSDNRTKEGLELLDRHKGITERSDYIRSAVEAFEEQDFTTQNGCLFVAPTNREVEALNFQIREKVKSFGQNYLINEQDKTIFIQSNMTVARSKLAINYASGDYILIKRRFQQFKNGEYYRIKSIDTDRNKIILENDRKIKLENHFADIVHGTLKTIKVGEGEKILCTARDKAHDLFNGEVLTVKNMQCRVDGENYIKCVNSNGKVKFMPLDFRHFKYAYAVTSHRSQGATVDKVVVAAGSLHSESAYVALSRGRKSCHIHTPNKYDLINNAMDYSRPLALDIINKEDKKYRLGFINPGKESRRITTALGKEQRKREAEKQEIEIPDKKDRKIKEPEKEIIETPEISREEPEITPPGQPERIEPPEEPEQFSYTPPERNYIEKHIERIREKEQEVRDGFIELEKDLVISKERYDGITNRLHDIPSDRQNIEDRISKRKREWKAEENRFFNKINPFKTSDLEKSIFNSRNELDYQAMENLRKEEDNLWKQNREALKEVQRIEYQLEKAHFDNVYGLDMKNFAEARELLRNGEIKGDFVPFLDNLEGITKIIGNVEFGRTDLKNLGDVREITGTAKFAGSKIHSLSRLEKVDSLVLKDSKVKDINNLKTVRDFAIANNVVPIEKWAEVNIGGKLHIDGKDVIKEYYHLRGQDREYEEKIRREQNDLYHSRGRGR